MTIRSMPSTKEYRENWDRIFEAPRRERAERERAQLEENHRVTEQALRAWSPTGAPKGGPADG